LPSIHWLEREDVVRCVGFADIAGRAPDHDHQFGFVIELLGLLLRDGDGAAAIIERAVELVEQDRHFRHRIAGLGGVPAIVEADADDLLRIGNGRSELRLVLGDEVTAFAGAGFGGEPFERANVALALEHRGDRGGSAFLEILFGRGNVEDAALGAQAEAVTVAPAQRRECHAFGHVLRFAASRRHLGGGGLDCRTCGHGGNTGKTGNTGGLQECPAIMLHGHLPDLRACQAARRSQD
jgi:hypothetical protein